ncbi:BolA family transcriptional regulator [Albimonas sp. CAU 1670]|uniref:BolA family protein n=1 Tax=Albimonas sp. CAU 1670 TaxID=3032599 RepID=UPI0023DCB194|nr:BolA family protein [Albimonas sp. CAU 1670]MDF2231984.1 BolA family transcriptional regulator [Albimonas sp. CAU 1670]
MREKLVAEFNPSELAIVDESESHRGHGGYRDGGETHFRVHVRSAAFDGKSRVQRQRLVMTLLKPEMEARVHALSLSLAGEADG